MPAKKFVMPADAHPSDYLFEWAFIPLDDKPMPDGTVKPGVLHELAELALPENWSHGSEPAEKSQYPILKNYLVNTFFKQYIDSQILENSHLNQHFAAFNTGLVNKLYNPIYALFERNPKGSRPWKFYAFCNANIGRAGQTLVQHFSQLPPAPRYFTSADDVVFNPSIEIVPRYDHIIDDSIARGRYPSKFLSQHVPEGVIWRNPDEMSDEAREKYLQTFTQALKLDPKTERNIHNRLDDAIELAVKRARWNYQTAIPLYYPRKRGICLLLPLALVDDEKVDLALIVSRTISGGYSGETVYPLNWAYEHAGLVCKPDSNWLTALSQESAGRHAPAESERAIKPAQAPAAMVPPPAQTSAPKSPFGGFAAPAPLTGIRQVTCPHCRQVYSIPRDKLTDLPRGATCKACGNRFVIEPE